jgi:hypothetical protein
MAHPSRLVPWIRLVVGAFGLALAGPVLALFVLGPDWRNLRADDFIAFAVLAPFAAFGVLFLAIGLTGRTPKWLPLYEPGMGRAARGGVLLGLGFVAAMGLTHALESWLHTRLGLGSRISWWLSLLPLTIAFGVYAHRAQSSAGDEPKSRPAA